MARFVDLEEEADDGTAYPREDAMTQRLPAHNPVLVNDELAAVARASSHCSDSIARAFQCYPYVLSPELQTARLRRSRYLELSDDRVRD
jgi:hypothetical protein